MPKKKYVYAVFYQLLAVNPPYVIMAQKNLIGYKGDQGKQDKPIAWNYGGQWVLPGGGAEYDITSNQNLLKDVRREIEEELGPAVKNIVDKISPECISYRRFKENAFGVVYFDVPDAYVLQDTINESIKQGTAHDEIYTTEVFFKQEALSLLDKPLQVPQMPRALKDQYETVAKHVDVRITVDEQLDPKRDRDWFKEALNAIPDWGLVASEAGTIKKSNGWRSNW